MGELAYHQYRAAYKIADKAKLLKKQVKLRGYMVLCLYFTYKFLEAPLYALAYKFRIHIMLQQQELNETKGIFDKVNGRKKEESKKEEENLSLDSNTEVKSEIKSEIKFEIKSEIKLVSDFNNTMALVKIKDQEISFYHRRVIQNSISNDLTNMTTKLFVEADRSLVRYQASNKEILSAKKHATLNIFKGQLSMVSGVVSGGSSVIVGLTNIYKATSTLGIPALLIVGGAAAIGFGVWCGLSLYKKGTKMLKEPKIREKLNEIMIKVLGAYDKGEYQEFIDTLSEEYDEKNHKSLIKCCNGIGIKGTDGIVGTLKMHGFSIAYLLILLGKVLGSGKIIIGVTRADFRKHAKRIFQSR